VGEGVDCRVSFGWLQQLNGTGSANSGAFGWSVATTDRPTTKNCIFSQKERGREYTVRARILSWKWKRLLPQV
jgi:hypothetical protein